jgi:hypothetical protein
MKERSLLPMLVLLLGVGAVAFGVYLYRQNVSQMVTYGKEISESNVQKAEFENKLTELKAVALPKQNLEKNLEESWLKLSDDLKVAGVATNTPLSRIQTSEQGTKELSKIVKDSPYKGVKTLDIKAMFSVKANPTFVFSAIGQAIKKHVVQVTSVEYDQKRGVAIVGLKLYGTLKEKTEPSKT